MSIRHDFDEQLNQLPRSAAGGASGTIHVDVAGGRLDCELSQVDSIGCAVDKLKLRTDQLRDASPERLKQTGDRIAERMRYLLEPIAPIECDREAGVVRMRSDPPTRDASGTKYYEVDVSRDEGVTFSRFRSKSGQPREPIPAHLTRETLGQLAEDLVNNTIPS